MSKRPGEQELQLFRIKISSELPLEYRDELERIVFFNPDQARVLASLERSIRRYGVPSIEENKSLLRLSVPAVKASQSLYAFDESMTPARLAGVVMFVRDPNDSSAIVILHLAIHEDYASDGISANEWLATRLMSTVRGICLRTRGVTSLRVLYPRDTRFAL